MTAAATQKHPHSIDLRFQQFGLWYVLGKAPGQQQLPMWLCQCACGTQAALHADALVEGRARSCGCDYVDTRGYRRTARDLTGQVLAGYLVLNRVECKIRHRYWNCACLGCGATKEVRGGALAWRKHTNGCLECAAKNKSSVQIGGRYGDLTVQHSVGVKQKKRGQIFLCVCRCGREVEVLGGNLKTGNTTSCGCKRTRKVRVRLQSHHGWWEVIGPRRQQCKDEAGKTVRAKVLCRCHGCGIEKWVNVGSLLYGKSNSCRACRNHYRDRNAQQQREEACA